MTARCTFHLVQKQAFPRLKMVSYVVFFLPTHLYSWRILISILWLCVLVYFVIFCVPLFSGRTKNWNCCRWAHVYRYNKSWHTHTQTHSHIYNFFGPFVRGLFLKNILMDFRFAREKNRKSWQPTQTMPIRYHFEKKLLISGLSLKTHQMLESSNKNKNNEWNKIWFENDGNK